jgi:hypothetical protein
VLEHELGHVLGLSHGDADAFSVMAEVLQLRAASDPVVATSRPLPPFSVTPLPMAPISAVLGRGTVLRLVPVKRHQLSRSSLRGLVVGAGTRGWLQLARPRP